LDADTVVVGAGVVGLAIARTLAESGRDVLVVERESAIGTATSSRNSGVIHAGIYYAPNSLKARLCVRGKALLYEYCAIRGVPHSRCGKLIVATTEAETDALRCYQDTAVSNGAGELCWLTSRDVAELEPEVRCVAALHSPSSGIVDVPALMLALRADIESSGGHIVLNTALVRAEVISGGFAVMLADPSPLRVTCRALVNSAGLEAAAVAARIAGLDERHVALTRYARGHYFSLRGAPPFRRLVYPIPAGGGLGIHATVDLGKRVRFGPDVEWIDQIDYRFGAVQPKDFAAEIRRYYPAVDETRLSADYTGIRPKLYGPGELPADFRIDGAERHGVNGLVNLFGIESPGLTASLAIGTLVSRLVDASSDHLGPTCAGN
jgi:L-2-hydroxyglutarate oxidase LhgO